MKTKLTFLATIIGCAVTVSSFGQNNLIAKNNYNPQRINLANEAIALQAPAFSYNNVAMRQKSIEHYRKLKTAGIITTGLGVGCFIGGIAMIASEANDPYYDANDPGPTATAGALGIIGSVPAVLGGVTMWVIGGVNNAKMKKQGLGFSNTKNGMGLVYKF